MVQTEENTVSLDVQALANSGTKEIKSKNRHNSAASILNIFVATLGLNLQEKLPQNPLSVITQSKLLCNVLFYRELDYVALFWLYEGLILCLYAKNGGFFLVEGYFYRGELAISCKVKQNRQKVSSIS